MVITVSYNSSAQLKLFIASAINSSIPANQILVVDNNSEDIAITEMLAQEFGFSLLKLNSNFGYGTAINRAVSLLDSSISTLLICNPDCVLKLQTLEALSQAVEQNNIGAVGPRIFNEDGTIYASARSIPSIRDGVGHALFANIWPSNPWTKKYLSNTHFSNKQTVAGWVSGACFAIQKNRFNEVSGFDEKYFMYFEDVDLCYRLGKLGYTNLYVPEVSITHTGGESTKAIKKTMLRIHHESAMRFIRLKYKGILWAPIRGVIRLGLAIRFRLQARKATT